ISYDKLMLYDVQTEQLLKVLRMQLNDDKIGVLRSDQQQIPILLGDQTEPSKLQDLLNKAFVINNEGNYVPIRELVYFSKKRDYVSLYLGKDGAYVPLELKVEDRQVPIQKELIATIVSAFPSLTTRFTGNYYRNQAYLKELSIVIIIAIGMLFFILAAQFESLQQPFIVLLTIVFGITGSLVCLYVAGSSLNIMSSIGIIVLIGLLDNDSILKMDTMNR